MRSRIGSRAAGDCMPRRSSERIRAKDAWSAMRAIGVEGIEVDADITGRCGHLFAPDEHYSIATPEEIEKVGARFKEEQRRITAFCLHTDFDTAPGKHVQYTIRTMRAAVKLNVPALRIDFRPRRLAGKEEEYLKFAIDIGRRLVDAARDLPVRFGVENHGWVTNRPDFLRRMFDGVGSTQFGLTLDTANFYWFGHPLTSLYSIYDEFGSFVCHTHCKSIHYPPSERQKTRPSGWEYEKYAAPLDEGDIDFKRVVQILRKHRYTNDLCIENEMLARTPHDQHRAILTREARLLRDAAL